MRQMLSNSSKKAIKQCAAFPLFWQASNQPDRGPAGCPVNRNHVELPRLAAAGGFPGSVFFLSADEILLRAANSRVFAGTAGDVEQVKTLPGDKGMAPLPFHERPAPVVVL